MNATLGKSDFMRSLVKQILILLVVVGSSCSPTGPSSIVESQYRSEIPESDASFSGFWRMFRSALKKNDVSAVQRMTRFPLEGGLQASPDFAGVDTHEGFRRHFGMLFPEDAIRTLLTKTPELDDRHSGARGMPEAWSVVHTTTTILTEGEWTESSIIYQFTRLGDGQIKLTSITIAG